MLRKALFSRLLQRTRSRGKVRNINDMFFSEFWHLRFPFSDLTLASKTNCSWANRWSVQKARHSDKYGRADQKYWNACSATRWTAKGNRATILGKEPISWYPEQQRHLEVTASRNAERCQIIIKTKKEVTSDGWYRRRERRGNIILVYILLFLKFMQVCLDGDKNIKDIKLLQISDLHRQIVQPKQRLIARPWNILRHQFYSFTCKQENFRFSNTAMYVCFFRTLAQLRALGEPVQVKCWIFGSALRGQ